MVAKKETFETQLANLEQIVSNLENGSIPLEEALDQFQVGVKLSKELETKLNSAQETVAKLMDQDGQLKNLDMSENSDAK